MSFSVMWSRAAENDLAAAVRGDRDRDSLIEVAQGLEQALAIDPMNVGESRDSRNLRVAFFPPLHIAFHLNEQDRWVMITRAKRIGS